MRGLVMGDLTIEVREDTGQVLELHWFGSSNNQAPAESLRSFFDVALAEAAARKLRLAMHFERLQYFNSSTVVVLLAFLRGAAGRGVSITFCYDPSLRWQAHNFVALQQMEKDNPSFTIVEIGAGSPPEVIGDP
ncbi:MAG: hypothetical protein AB1938_12690 [Myxococcota bacterium]